MRYDSPAIALRREKFKSAIIAGASQYQAALDAGYSPKSARTLGARLANDPAFKAEVDASRAKLAKRREISQARIAEELASIGYASMRDYVRLSDAGDPVIDLTQADEVNWRAIKTLEVDEYKDGRTKDAPDVKRTRITLHDKQTALISLAKMCGFMPDHRAQPDADAAQKHTEDITEIAKRLAFVLSSGARNVAAPVTIEQAQNDGLVDGSDGNPSAK